MSSSVFVTSVCRNCNAKFELKPCAMILDFCETCTKKLGRRSDPEQQRIRNRAWFRQKQLNHTGHPQTAFQKNSAVFVGKRFNDFSPGTSS
jgi:hypothetical protein